MSEMTPACAVAAIGLETANSDGQWIGNDFVRVLVGPTLAKHKGYGRFGRGRRTGSLLKRLVKDQSLRLTEGERSVARERDVELPVVRLNTTGERYVLVNPDFYDGVTLLARPDSWFAVPLHPSGASMEYEHPCYVLVVAQRGEEIVGLIAPIGGTPGPTISVIWHPDSCLQEHMRNDMPQLAEVQAP